MVFKSNNYLYDIVNLIGIDTMFTRLILILFVLQTFSTTASAWMGMSDLNQAEKTQMHLVHEALLDNNKQHLMPSMSQNNSMNCCDTIVMDDDCCHNLVCHSFHATNYFYPTQVLIKNFSPRFHYDIPVNTQVHYSNSQPETPPPLA